MSHIDQVAIEIKSMDALKEACVALGLTLMTGQKTYAWYGTSVGDYPLPEGMTKADLGKCSHAIKVPGAQYEVGVVQNKKTGHFGLVYDFWGTTQGEPIMKRLGKGLEKLKAEYAAQAAIEQAQRRGLRVTRTLLPDNRLRLRIQ